MGFPDLKTKLKTQLSADFSLSHSPATFRGLWIAKRPIWESIRSQVKNWKTVQPQYSFHGRMTQVKQPSDTVKGFLKIELPCLWFLSLARLRMTSDLATNLLRARGLPNFKSTNQIVRVHQFNFATYRFAFTQLPRICRLKQIILSRHFVSLHPSFSINEHPVCFYQVSSLAETSSLFVEYFYLLLIYFYVGSLYTLFQLRNIDLLIMTNQLRVYWETFTMTGEFRKVRI